MNYKKYPFNANVTTCNKISLIFSQRLFSFLTESSAELYLKVYIVLVLRFCMIDQPPMLLKTNIQIKSIGI